MNQYYVAGTHLYLILRSWGAPEHVSLTQLLKFQRLHLLWPGLATVVVVVVELMLEEVSQVL